MKHIIVFTDIGDTVVDEGTEVYEGDTVVSADLIPGAYNTMRAIYDAGYPVVMVADGLVRSFHNTMERNGLADIFSARIISEEVGEDKPSAKMFQAAMDALGLTDADKGRIIMVGNNLKRDILGANRFGIHSVLIDWAPRRSMIPETDEEVPEYTIHTPAELLPLVDRLEKEFIET